MKQQKNYVYEGKNYFYTQMLFIMVCILNNSIQHMLLHQEDIISLAILGRWSYKTLWTVLDG